MLTSVSRKYSNTDEYHRMVEGNMLSAQDQTELIEGQVILYMSPIGSRHAACVKRLNAT